VLFAGDAAHGVSPFGARGANSGVQDADNIAWKLRFVVEGRAPDRLLDTYDEERIDAADENIVNSTRSTDFITPKSEISRTFRDAVLGLAREHPFARRLVNSGRLSVPATLAASRLNTPDVDAFGSTMVPGAAALDAPVTIGGRPGWLLDHLGSDFTLLCFADDEGRCAAAVAALDAALPLRIVIVADDQGSMPHTGGETTVVFDSEGKIAARYDASVGSAYLLRPDQHVCARWRAWTAGDVRAALARATCGE
jgi:3-(3-hydroxy-phenyl)propionate hydroxylase